MRQINLPQKTRSLVQVWVSVLLIILAIIFAFNPILTLDMTDNSLSETMTDAMDMVGEVMDDDEISDFDIPDKVDVTTFKVIRSVTVFAKFIGLSAKTASSAVDEDDTALRQSVREMENLLKSKEGQEALILGFALASQAIDLEDLVDDKDKNKDNDPSDMGNGSARVPVFSDTELEEILGVLYSDGLISEYRIDEYLNVQARLFQNHKKAYLADLGVKDEVENFSDLDADDMFAQLKASVENYISSQGVSNVDGSDVTYESILALKNEIGDDMFSSIFFGLDNYLSDDLRDMSNQYATGGISAGDSEPKKLADFLLYHEIITPEEYDDILIGDIYNGFDVDADALRDLLDERDLEDFIDEDGYTTLMGSGDADKEAASSVGVLIKTILSFIILLYIVGYVVLWPFIMLIAGLIALIKALVNVKKPEIVAVSTASKMISPLVFTVATMLLITFFPGVHMGWGLIVVFVLSILSVVTNVVVSRLRAYNKGDFEYATLIQAGAGVELIGFAFFLVGLLNTGFIRRFLNIMCDYLTTSIVANERLNEEILFYNDYFNTSFNTVPMNMMYLIDLALILVAAVMALSVATAIIRAIAGHLSLTKNSSIPGSLGNPIVALLVCIFPLAATFLKSNVTYTMTADGVKKSATSLLTLGDSTTALVLMFVGAVILLGAAIAFRVVKKNLCPDILPEQQKLILTGNAPEFGTVAEITATGEIIFHDGGAVPAEESPAEGIPAEETASEEVDSEETPTDTPEA